MTVSSATPQIPSESAEDQLNRRGSGWTWIAFSTCALIAVALFFVPVFIIRPFRYQAPRALWMAMALRQRAPIGTLLAAVACSMLALVLWRTASGWRKAFLAAGMLVVAFSAIMARQNHFEWMFHPITDAKFLAQSDSKLDAKEMILAVNLGSDARAYPISQMAYHHILNDVVGGVPIAVTY